jgi:hypothetical protein
MHRIQAHHIRLCCPYDMVQTEASAVPDLQETPERKRIHTCAYASEPLAA